MARKRGRTAAVAPIDSNISSQRKRQHKDNEVKKEFNGIVRDIQKLVLPHLGKFERRKIEEEKRRALGCKPCKNQKMPLPELQSRRRAAASAIQQQMEEEARLGIRICHGKKTFSEAQQQKKRYATIAKTSRLAVYQQ